MLFDNSFILMLVYVDEDWMDIAGNRYPIEGDVEAKEYSEDIDISKGLYGIPWGKTCYFPYERINKGHWIVVKVEKSEEMVRVEEYYNRYKFRLGTVVFCGSIQECAKYIIKNKNGPECLEEALWVQPEEIAGSDEWLKEHIMPVR